MANRMNRLEFLQMLGVGGIVFATGLPGFGAAPATPGEDFFFAQLADTHWGFEGPKANPDAAGTLPKAIAAVNGLARQPDFVIFTGDLTHNTDDPTERRARMAAFKTHAAKLRVPKDSPLVIFAHRPLFDLYPDWDWHTADGSDALALLKDHRFVTVFYGHIHQEHHHATGHILHHAATSLIFPLPAPGSQPKRAPVPWDPEHPYRGLGFREVRNQSAGASPGALRSQILEEPLASFLPATQGQP
jgi:hypothetical protein